VSNPRNPKRDERKEEEEEEEKKEAKQPVLKWQIVSNPRLPVRRPLKVVQILSVTKYPLTVSSMENVKTHRNSAKRFCR